MDAHTPVTDIIRSRTSRRTYLSESLPDEMITRIRQKCREAASGPMGTNIEFSLISLRDISNQKLKLGTYGFIQGARHFVAGTIEPSKEAFLDYGYCLEKLILEFIRMGLGTCWLGGTFNRSEYAKALQLNINEVIPAITPVGWATENRRLGDRLIRLSAGSIKRLPHEQLFFNQTITIPLVLPKDHPYKTILESVRLAPSASNNQPWRIIAEGNHMHFHISRKPGYQKAFSEIDLQMVDMGIAMAHFDLVARELGKIPEWRISPGNRPSYKWEYVISVLLPE